MTRIVLKYGLASGLVLATLTAILVPLCINAEGSELVGYSAMVLSFLLVFFGVRAYRETQGGGRITFWKAFQVGILITLITCAFYVVTWEIAYHGFFPDFLDTYQSKQLEKMQAKGATEEAIQAAKVEMEKFAELYANPLFNVAITFLEVFPVGLIVTLVTAAILRRRPEETPAAPAVA